MLENKKEYLYFKNLLINGRERITPDKLKNFTPGFYNLFKNAAIKSAAAGYADYNSVFNTEFYKNDSGAYCVFLEFFYSSDVWHNIKTAADHKKAAAAVCKYYTDPRCDLSTLHTDLIKIYGNIETAFKWLINNDSKIRASIRS